MSTAHTDYHKYYIGALLGALELLADTPYSMGDEFEWDETKAARILANHGISFERAMETFTDVFAVEDRDPDSGAYGEERYVITGADFSGRLLTVVYIERSRRRIISARKATACEQENYHR